MMSHGGDTGSKPVGTAKDFSRLEMTLPISPQTFPPFFKAPFVAGFSMNEKSQSTALPNTSNNELCTVDLS
jgi:hypothetical protein